MDRNIVLRKIIDGAYDTRTNAFVKSYDDIFKWVISREHRNILSTNIYSIDFRLVWEDEKNILEPCLADDHIMVHVNNSILPRYGFTLVYWLKDLHERSEILSDHFIRDIKLTIVSYIL